MTVYPSSRPNTDTIWQIIPALKYSWRLSIIMQDLLFLKMKATKFRSDEKGLLMEVHDPLFKIFVRVTGQEIKPAKAFGVKETKYVNCGSVDTALKRTHIKR